MATRPFQGSVRSRSFCLRVSASPSAPQLRSLPTPSSGGMRLCGHVHRIVFPTCFARESQLVVQVACSTGCRRMHDRSAIPHWLQLDSGTARPAGGNPASTPSHLRLSLLGAMRQRRPCINPSCSAHSACLEAKRQQRHQAAHEPRVCHTECGTPI